MRREQTESENLESSRETKGGVHICKRDKYLQTGQWGFRNFTCIWINNGPPLPVQNDSSLTSVRQTLQDFWEWTTPVDCHRGRENGQKQKQNRYKGAPLRAFKCRILIAGVQPWQPWPSSSLFPAISSYLILLDPPSITGNLLLDSGTKFCKINCFSPEFRNTFWCAIKHSYMK